MTQTTTFARRVFFWAGVYGIVAIVPQYFLEDALFRALPPPPNHPDHFYGFLGVALAWQFAFLVIARDVVRYRLMMVPAIAEKLFFPLSVFVLYARDRVPAVTIVPAAVDLMLGFLFLAAYLYIGKHKS